MKGSMTINAGDDFICVEASLTFTNDWKDQHDIGAIIDSLLSYEPKKPENIKTEAKEEEA